MLAILALLAVAVTTPKPIGIMVTNDDYPAEAVKQRWEGTVQFRIAVEPTRRTRQQLRHIDLKRPRGVGRATCSLMMRRGNFAPARDASGQPVEAELVQNMHWVLPSGPLKVPQPYRDLSILQTSAGPNCIINWDGHPRTIKPEICRDMAKGLRSAAASGSTVFKVSVDPEELVPE